MPIYNKQTLDNQAKELGFVRDTNETLGKYMMANGYELSPKSKTPHSLDSFVFNYTNCIY